MDSHLTVEHIGEDGDLRTSITYEGPREDILWRELAMKLRGEDGEEFQHNGQQITKRMLPVVDAP